MNLVGLSSRLRIIKELLLDSLMALSFLPEEGKYLDVGSGAGFPGIPLIICRPRLNAYFLEANGKKARFLRQVIRLTKLRHVDVVIGRIENEEGLLDPEGYQIITARALAPLPQTLKWCTPHLMNNGLFLSFQGTRYNDSLEQSLEIIKKNRISLYESIPYTLPGKSKQRHLLVFRKVTR